MKKYISVLSAVLCVLLLASCASSEPETTKTYTEITVTEAETETEAQETETEKEQTEETTAAQKETTEELTADTEVTEEIHVETTAEPETIKEPETTKAPETEAPAKETDKETVWENEFGFKADLSAYEKYLDPEDKDEYLILVNPDNPLDRNYSPPDLVFIADSREGRNDKLREYAAKALEAFLKEATANGCKRITSVSAYRPYNTQEYIFNNEVKSYMQQGMTEEEAIAKTRSDTAYPGQSEHQSGLAVDILDDDSDLYEFEDTYEANWLAENAWKFGFILRYPKDKEEITTYVYEPWHFRYVGRYHAKRIYEMGMCLEEYVEFLKTE